LNLKTGARVSSSRSSRITKFRCRIADRGVCYFSLFRAQGFLFFFLKNALEGQSLSLFRQMDCYTNSVSAPIRERSQLWRREDARAPPMETAVRCGGGLDLRLLEKFARFTTSILSEASARDWGLTGTLPHPPLMTSSGRFGETPSVPDSLLSRLPWRAADVTFLATLSFPPARPCPATEAPHPPTTLMRFESGLC